MKIMEVYYRILSLGNSAPLNVLTSVRWRVPIIKNKNFPFYMLAPARGNAHMKLISNDKF